MVDGEEDGYFETSGKWDELRSLVGINNVNEVLSSAAAIRFYEEIGAVSYT